MLEKIGLIRNPLTIIGLFAGIVEVSGTAVLPLVDKTLQATYVWFLVAFPVLLVVLFFATLILKPQVLYAPSDYQDERHFLSMLRKGRPAEIGAKLREEVEDMASSSGEASQPQPQGVPPEVTSTNLHLLRRDARATYILAEDLVMKKLSVDLETEVDRGVMFNLPGLPWILDGVALIGKVFNAIEVKYFRTEEVQMDRISDTLTSIGKVFAKFAEEDTEDSFRLILAIATDAPDSSREPIRRQVQEAIEKHNYPIEIRVYVLGALEQEFGYC